MAEKLDERPTTVQGWKNVGRVPSTKQPHVLHRGAELDLDVTPFDVVFPLSRRARHAGLLSSCAAVAPADPAPAIERRRA